MTTQEVIGLLERLPKRYDADAGSPLISLQEAKSLFARVSDPEEESDCDRAEREILYNNTILQNKVAGILRRLEHLEAEVKLMSSGHRAH